MFVFWLRSWGCTATWMSVFDRGGENRTEIIPSSVYSWLLGSRRIQGLGCILLFDDLFFLTWLPHCFFFFSFCCVTLWFNVLCYLCMSRKSGKWLLLFGFIFLSYCLCMLCWTHRNEDECRDLSSFESQTSSDSAHTLLCWRMWKCFCSTLNMRLLLSKSSPSHSPSHSHSNCPILHNAKESNVRVRQCIKQ